jgi:hypothetical protein
VIMGGGWNWFRIMSIGGLWCGISSVEPTGSATTLLLLLFRVRPLQCVHI